MPRNKLPGNDGITKEFYEAFWDDLKTPLLLSFNKAFRRIQYFSKISSY